MTKMKAIYKSKFTKMKQQFKQSLQNQSIQKTFINSIAIINFTLFKMDLISSVFNIYGTVAEKSRQIRIVTQKLKYQIQKGELLMASQKFKSAPEFMAHNLQHKIEQAREYYQKLSAITNQKQISLKQKIILSLPFNKSLQNIRHCTEELQKAFEDVNQFADSFESQPNGKRSVVFEETLKQKQKYKIQKCRKKQQPLKEQKKKFVVKSQKREESPQYIEVQPIWAQDAKFQKEYETMESFNQGEQCNSVIQEAYMGPTIQEDVAIQFSKNRYVQVDIQLCGKQQIINHIKDLNKDLLTFSNKILIKYKKPDNQVDQIELFSFDRLYFKSIYAKLKQVFVDVDRISKNKHFVVKLKREKQYVKVSLNNETQVVTNNVAESNNNASPEEFVSFPCTGQQIVLRHKQKFIIQRNQQKSLHIQDATEQWIKMIETQKQLENGQKIATFIEPKKQPQKPDFYLTIRCEFLDSKQQENQQQQENQ